MARSIKVKICGMTRLDDALEACRLGADALGFIFYKKSPRYITPQKAAQIIKNIPPFISTVGVFVNETTQHVQTVRQESGVEIVQLHGEESPRMCKEIGGSIIKAFRTGEDFDTNILRPYDEKALLLDAYDADAYGGTGKRCDWSVARTLAKQYRLILAGGITPHNVVEAVAKVHPYALDISSGVECEPGRKDHKKMADLFTRLG